LGEEAYHGLAGEIVGAILPHKEADAPSMLSVLLTFVGNTIGGRGAHWRVEGDLHYCKDNVVIVGESSKGRKGTTQGRVEAVISHIDPNRASSHSRLVHTYISHGRRPELDSQSIEENFAPDAASATSIDHAAPLKARDQWLCCRRGPGRRQRS
jgi:hypothetical protein